MSLDDVDLQNRLLDRLAAARRAAELRRNPETT